MARCEAERSPQSSAEVNAWSCTSILQYIFTLSCLNKRFVFVVLCTGEVNSYEQHKDGLDLISRGWQKLAIRRGLL
jgi:hypothetical protein